MEPREMENLEKVEQLVDKAGCTYAEAKEALEYTDWNLLDAIIRLEHDGKARKSSAAYQAADPQEAPKSGAYVEPEVIRGEEAEQLRHGQDRLRRRQRHRARGGPPAGPRPVRNTETIKEIPSCPN